MTIVVQKVAVRVPNGPAVDRKLLVNPTVNRYFFESGKVSERKGMCCTQYMRDLYSFIIPCCLWALFKSLQFFFLLIRAQVRNQSKFKEHLEKLLSNKKYISIMYKITFFVDPTDNTYGIVIREEKDLFLLFFYFRKPSFSREIVYLKVKFFFQFED